MSFPVSRARQAGIYASKLWGLGCAEVKQLPINQPLTARDWGWQHVSGWGARIPEDPSGGRAILQGKAGQRGFPLQMPLLVSCFLGGARALTYPAPYSGSRPPYVWWLQQGVTLSGLGAVLWVLPTV